MDSQGPSHTGLPSAPPVGSYVWSHLTSVQRSEDPRKEELKEALPDDIISRDFETEFLKSSSYSDHTLSSGDLWC